MTSRLRSSLLLPGLQGLVLRLVEPPGVEGDRRVARALGWPPEAVPVGDVGGAAVPVGHYEVAPQQHTVERARGVDQAFTVGRADQGLDQIVDRGVLDADRVAASHSIGCLGAPEVALFVARRQR